MTVLHLLRRPHDATALSAIPPDAPLLLLGRGQDNAPDRPAWVLDPVGPVPAGHRTVDAGEALRLLFAHDKVVSW